MSHVDTTRLSPQEAMLIPEVEQIFNELERTLDPRFTYHCVEHSLTVLADALMLAQAEGCSHHDQVILAIAAAFHDAGFLDRATENEAFGARRARSVMGRGGYSPGDITAVEQLILDTTMVRSLAGVLHLPRHALSPYLLDADLANLGRVSFWDQFERMRRELGAERHAFALQTLKLFEAHRWLTRTAGELWKSQTRMNLEGLKRLAMGNIEP